MTRDDLVHTMHRLGFCDRGIWDVEEADSLEALYLELGPHDIALAGETLVALDLINPPVVPVEDRLFEPERYRQGPPWVLSPEGEQSARWYYPFGVLLAGLEEANRLGIRTDPGPGWDAQRSPL